MYKVALIYNLKKEAKDPGMPDDYYSEFDSPKTISSIAQALVAKGNEVTLVEANENLIINLKNKGPFDIAFNIAEGTNGHSRESQVPAILDFLKIPYTGSDVLALAISLDKAVTKKILRSEGILTPDFQVFSGVDEKLKAGLKFPLIVKPNSEGSAKGILATSVVRDEKRLYQEIERVCHLYDQQILVEEFIEGMELTIAMIGNEDIRALPPMEIDFSSCKKSGEFFYSWRMKEFQGNKEMGLVPDFYCPARLEKSIMQKVEETAKKTHRAIGCSDLSRVDIRLSKDNIPYVLEINPLPGLDPLESNFTIIAKSCGMDYIDLINSILNSALKRWGIRKSRSKKAHDFPPQSLADSPSILAKNS